MARVLVHDADGDLIVSTQYPVDNYTAADAMEMVGKALAKARRS